MFSLDSSSSPGSCPSFSLSERQCSGMTGLLLLTLFTILMTTMELIAPLLIPTAPFCNHHFCDTARLLLCLLFCSGKDVVHVQLCPRVIQIGLVVMTLTELLKCHLSDVNRAPQAKFLGHMSKLTPAENQVVMKFAVRLHFLPVSISIEWIRWVYWRMWKGVRGGYKKLMLRRCTADTRVGNLFPMNGHFNSFNLWLVVLFNTHISH